MTELLKVAVVGLGAGRMHLASLAKRHDVKIVAVCDIIKEVADKFAAAHRARAFTDMATMLQEARPEAISLCTPPSLHAAQTELAASRGVHVLCEKPMAGRVGDCERMIAAAERAGVTLMIAQKKRFHPFYAYLKAQTQKEWGPILWAQVRFALGRVEKDWFWKEGDGGGPLVENSVHVFDLMRYLMGDVEKVFAFGGTLFMNHRAPQIDAAAATLKFVSGGIAGLSVGYGSEWPMAREQMAFATPKIVVDCDGGFDRPNVFRGCYRDNPAKPLCLDFPSTADFAGFDAEIDHFLACVREGREPIAPGRDGKEAVRLCLAVKESVRTGRVIEMCEYTGERVSG
jgi:predicted dehydrogenase